MTGILSKQTCGCSDCHGVKKLKPALFVCMYNYSDMTFTICEATRSGEYDSCHGVIDDGSTEITFTVCDANANTNSY